MEEQSIIVALGSNLGNRFSILENAKSQIEDRIGEITLESSWYCSEPIGFDSNEEFLNGCIQVITKLSPEETLKELMLIESELGRVRSNIQGYESRPIDLDIILFGELIIHSETLEIPHPRYHQRKFVLEPLTEIQPSLIDPICKLTMSQLLKNCVDKSFLSIYVQPSSPKA